MESATETHVVERELTIEASPETVWEFLVDPDKATAWMGQEASFDPRPGGLYRVDVIPGHTALGEFVELDPPRRLVYTWGWEKGGERAQRRPAGLVHDRDRARTGGRRDSPSVRAPRPADTEATESHAHGWDHYLARLVVAARGADPGPDPWISGDMSR